MPTRLFPSEFPKEYEKLLPYLPWLDQRILEAYYGLAGKRYTQAEIAEKFEVSTIMIRKVMKRAFSRLEHLVKE